MTKNPKGLLTEHSSQPGCPPTVHEEPMSGLKLSPGGSMGERVCGAECVCVCVEGKGQRVG